MVTSNLLKCFTFSSYEELFPNSQAAITATNIVPASITFHLIIIKVVPLLRSNNMHKTETIEALRNKVQLTPGKGY